ncbi:MAG: helix-turn-helix domain-containing protein [bacterium]
MPDERAQEQIERSFLRSVLEQCGGNVSAAARKTGLHRSVLHEMMARHGIRSLKKEPEES